MAPHTLPLLLTHALLATHLLPRAAADTAILCGNSPGTLSCPPGTYIDPGTAVYGRTDATFTDCGMDPTGTNDCANTRALTTVEQLCKGETSCTFDVDTNTFPGDPCSGVRKYLNATFDCLAPVPMGAMADADACEDTPLVLRCEAGTFIDVVSVTYGRLATTEDNCGFAESTVTDCSRPGAGDVVVEACEGETECTIETVTNALFGGDPCPTVKKVLEVKYQCIEMPPMENVLCEGQEGQLSCPVGEVIEITSATYGRSQKVPTCFPGSIGNTNCGRVNNVLSILEDQCNEMNSCDIESNNDFFGIGDPCPGTRKYLNYTFECGDGAQQCGDLFADGVTVNCFNTRTRGAGIESIETPLGDIGLSFFSREGDFVLTVAAPNRTRYFDEIRADVFMSDQGVLSPADLSNTLGSNFWKNRRLFWDPFTLEASTDCCDESIFIYVYAVMCEKEEGTCETTDVTQRVTTYKCTDACTGTLTPYSAALRCPMCT